jgi:hypothetical protein
MRAPGLPGGAVVVPVSAQGVPPDAPADREPGPAWDGSGDLQPVVKLVVWSVPAEHDAPCLPSGADRHGRYRDGIIVPVQTLDLPERRLHALVPQVFHDPQGVPGP